MSALLLVRHGQFTYLIIYYRKSRYVGAKSMTLEFVEAVKVLEEHIEVLKQNLLFLMAERKPENMTQIIAVKSELDKSVQEK